MKGRQTAFTSSFILPPSSFRSVLTYKSGRFSYRRGRPARLFSRSMAVRGTWRARPTFKTTETKERRDEENYLRGVLSAAVRRGGAARVGARRRGAEGGSLRRLLLGRGRLSRVGRVGERERQPLVRAHGGLQRPLQRRRAGSCARAAARTLFSLRPARVSAPQAHDRLRLRALRRDSFQGRGERALARLFGDVHRQGLQHGPRRRPRR